MNAKIDEIIVVGIGDIDIDIYLRVHHIPGRDEKIKAEEVELHPGGMVANFLGCLQRLGTPCAFNGSLGDDEYGAMALAALKLIGVDTSGAVVKRDQKTYFCVVMLDDSGEKALVVAPTNCMFPTPDDISLELIAQSHHMHTTAANMATAMKATNLAKKFGLSTSVDLEPTMLDNMTGLMQLLANVDILFVNHFAARQLSKRDDIQEVAESILTLGPEIVCILMGAEGAIVATSNEVFHAEAFPVTVTDSTGAGDCFAAGFVHGYLQKWPLADTVLFASAVAAISIQHRGGHAGAPSREQVDAFLHSQGIALSY